MNTEISMPKTHWRTTSLLVSASMIFSTVAPFAEPLAPMWWSAPERAVLDSTATENNHAVANLGQAKWVATQALAELASIAPSLAVQIDLSTVFPDPPAIPDAAWYDAQKAPLNLGQLKAISHQFYDSLPPVWLADQALQNGITPWVAPYPWDINTPVEDNLKIANIGQLKAVFSLRFRQDIDNAGTGDGLPDVWEQQVIDADPNDAIQSFDDIEPSGHSPAADLDQDGFNNLAEHQLGFDPLVANASEEGAAAHWSFDVDGGNITVDQSGNGFDAELIAGPSVAPRFVADSGFIGGGMEFGLQSGSEASYMKLSNGIVQSAETLTYSFWYKTDDPSGGHLFLSAAIPTNTNELLFGAFSYQYEYWDCGDIVIKQNPTNWYDGRWHHHAFVRDAENSEVRIYIDGELFHSGAITAHLLNIHEDGLMIGQDQDSVGGGFAVSQRLRGIMDEVRFYRSAHTAEQIQELANVDGDGDGMPEVFEYLIIDADDTDSITRPEHVLPGADFDDDFVNNIDEFLAGTDPTVKDNLTDTDNDGLLDTWEIANFGSLSETAEGDADNDGYANGEEQASEGNPNDSSDGNPNVIDTDGDGLVDAEDADSDDIAVNWKKVNETSYAVIELSSPGGADLTKNWVYTLGEGGHVVMSHDGGEDYDPFKSGAPPKDDFQTYVWSPESSTWSAPLSQPDNLRGVGSTIDADGNVFGPGYGALGPDESWPGTKFASLTWAKNEAGWEVAVAEYPDGIGAAFSGDEGTWAQRSALMEEWPLLFGNGGRFVCQDASSSASSNEAHAHVFRLGINDDAPMVSAISSYVQNVQIEDYNHAGEPGGWHAATWNEYIAGQSQPGTTEKYEFAKLNSSGGIENNTPPPGEARKSIASIASIQADLLAPNSGDVVMWTTGAYELYIGSSAESGGQLSWQQPSKADATEQIGGQINSRGEGLLGTQLWRNGKWIPLDSLVDSQIFTNVRGLDINNQGLILAKAGGDQLVLLLPVEIAPEVLAVNSDFDEGRIDPATGYAIPDCDDLEIALESVRKHLDGRFEAFERVTDDMHQGWFGVNPNSVDDEFWDGANVTISKIDKIDPETGHSEGGHVRFYGKWGENAGQYRAIIPYDIDTLSANNLVSGGINKEPTESVYGGKSAFPENTEFFMEGVHPGKITLEWRYQKGDIDMRHEQEFEVYTKMPPLEWRLDLNYKIRLETMNDPSGEVNTFFLPLLSDGYTKNIERASEFYDFYRECYHEHLRSHPNGYPNALSWAGLARLAGSQVIGGLSDSQYGKLAAYGSIIVPPAATVIIADWSIEEIDRLQMALFQGGWQIFASAGWMHHAYRSSGIEAIEWVEENITHDEDARVLLSAWRLLHQGVLDHDKSFIVRAATQITDREQNHTIAPTWAVISTLGEGFADDMFSVLGKNSSSPQGLNFTDIFDLYTWARSSPPKPLGNLADAANRWEWIRPETSNGILDTWNSQPLSRKLSLSVDSLKNDSLRFSILSQFPLLPILSSDDEDVP